MELLDFHYNESKSRLSQIQLFFYLNIHIYTLISFSSCKLDFLWCYFLIRWFFTFFKICHNLKRCMNMFSCKWFGIFICSYNLWNIINIMSRWIWIFIKCMQLSFLWNFCHQIIKCNRWFFLMWFCFILLFCFSLFLLFFLFQFFLFFLLEIFLHFWYFKF